MGRKKNKIEQPEFQIIGIIGGAHPTAPIEIQPDITLASWRVYEASGYNKERTRHFVGYNVYDREGRASTPIQSFDPDTKIGKTASGRTYFIKGGSGNDMDADYIWGVFSRVNKLTDIKDVTNEYE